MDAESRPGLQGHAERLSVRQRRPVVYAAVVDRQLYRRAAAGRVHLLRSGRQIRPVKRHYRQYRVV